MLQENQLFANRYRLVKRLGQGAFSEVWKAEDTKVGNLTVALKVYAPDKGLDEDGAKVFGDEFAIVFNVHHSNLLTPSTFDEEKNSPYLVLPFCERGNATRLIGKADEREVAQFLHDVSSALAYLHESEIVHQDIKPDNVLMDAKGNFLVTDFGISTRIRSTLRRSVGDKKSAGTMAYMGPERFSKNPDPIKASDVWSLGATAFELMKGDVPFGDMGGGMQLAGAFVPDVPGSYSEPLKQLVQQCLAKEPWDRPTAAQLRDISEKYLRTGVWNLISLMRTNSTGSANVPRHDKGQTRQMVTVSDFESPTEKKPNFSTSQYNKEVKTSKRNKLPLIVVALILLTVVGVTTSIFVKKSKEKNNPEIVKVASEDSTVTPKSNLSSDTPKIVENPSRRKIDNPKPASGQNYATQNAQDAPAVSHSNRTSTNQQDQTTPAEPKPDQSSIYHGRGGTGSGGGQGSGRGTSSGIDSGEGAGSGDGVGYGTGHRGMVNNIDATINEEGQVCVEVHIASDGHVIDARVINNSRYKTTVTNRNIQLQCVARAKQARYKPGKEELRIIIFS